MPTYRVYSLRTASKCLGTVEADNEDEALNKSYELDDHVSICHQCAHEVDLGDPYETQIEKESD